MIDPKSSATTGYHIFLEPTGPVEQEVSAIIERLAHEHGSPTFKPHVTLLARIPAQKDEEAIVCTEKLAEVLSPVTLTLDHLEAEEKYFRALYIKIKEQEMMSALHKTASDIFSMDADPAYKAHMSLLYGNYSPESIASAMQRISLPSVTTFTIDRIRLYRTEGEVDAWYQVHESSIFA